MRQYWPRRICAVVVAVLCVVVSATAFAQEEARELFLQCRDAEDAGDAARACELCGRSFDLLKSQASAAALSRCEEGQGRLAKALAHEQAGLQRLRPSDSNFAARRAAAEARIASLEERVPRLELVWPEGQKVQLEVDGVPIPRQDELLVDPGEHALAITAPGHALRETTVTMVAGERARVELTPGPKLVTQVVTESNDGQLVAGVVVGGIGVLGLVGFAVTGGVILDRLATVEERCDPNARTCPPDAIDAASEGRVLNVVNAVSLGVGIAGIGAGLILMLTADDGSDAAEADQVVIRPSVAPAGLGPGLVGRF